MDYFSTTFVNSVEDQVVDLTPEEMVAIAPGSLLKSEVPD